MLVTTSEVRSTSTTAAWASPTTALAFIIFFIAAAAIGVGLACFCSGFSEAPLPGAACYVPVTSEGRWPANNHSGWSRPLLPDHAELAALEQRQLEAARARRGWRPISRALSSRFDKRTHRRLPADIMPAHNGCDQVSFQQNTTAAPERQSILGLALPQRNISAQKQQLAYIFALPNHARDSWCIAQNDAAGLAADRAFEAHLLEKSMLAEEEVAVRERNHDSSCSLSVNCNDPGVPTTESAPGNSDGWEWVDSFSPCPVGDEMLVVDISNNPEEQPRKQATLEPGDKRLFVELSQEEAACACPASNIRRQVIIKLGTGAYTINSSDELDALKRQATLSALEATGLSNISMFLTFNGQPVCDESSIFDCSGVLSCNDTFILHAAVPGGVGPGDTMDKSARANKRAKYAALKAKARANETAAERQERLTKQRAAQAKARAEETAAERQERLTKKRAAQTEALANETAAERQERLTKQRTVQAKALADETAAERQERLSEKRAIQTKALANETEAERQERLRKQKPFNDERKAREVEKQLPNTKLMDDDAFHAYTRVDALKSTPEFWQS